MVMMLGLSACAPTTPQWDSTFGLSARLAQQQQTLYPDAGGDDPVNGIDGATGRESIERYRSSYKEPPQQSNAFTIGVGR